MNDENTRYAIAFRSNDGQDHSVATGDLADAEKKAKGYRTPANYMVCITKDEERILRWDRDHMMGENRWRAVDVDEFETLGAIRSIVRSV